MDKEERDIMLRKLATIMPAPPGSDILEGYREMMLLIVDMDKRLKALEKSDIHWDDIHRENPVEK